MKACILYTRITTLILLIVMLSSFNYTPAYERENLNKGVQRFHYGEGVIYINPDSSIKGVCLLWNNEEYPIPIDYTWDHPLEKNTNWVHAMAKMNWLRCLLIRAESNQKAHNLLKQYLNNFIQYYSKKRGAIPHFFSDHAWAARLEFLTDCYCHFKSYEDQNSLFFKNFLSLLRYHIAQALNPGRVYRKNVFNNHQLMLTKALLYSYTKCPELFTHFDNEKLLATLNKRIKVISNHMFTKNGVTKEHSTDYQLFNLGILMDLFPLMQKSGMDTQFIEKIMEGAKLFIAYSILPDGNMPPIGDSEIPYPLTNARRLDTLLKDNGSELSKVLKYGANIDLKYRMIIWPLANIAIIRFLDKNRSLVHIFFASTRFSNTHKHNDDLSFTFFAEGHRIVVDPAYNVRLIHNPNYSHIKSLYSSANAHNVATPLHARWTHGRSILFSGLTGYSSGKDWLAIRGEHSVILNTKVQRTIILFKECNLFIIDKITSKTSRDIYQIFHIDPEMIVKREGDTFLYKSKDSRFYGRIIPLVSFDNMEVCRDITGKIPSFVIRYGRVIESPTVALSKTTCNSCTIATLIQFVPFGASDKSLIETAKIKLHNNRIKISYRENGRWKSKTISIRKIKSDSPIKVK